MKYERLRRRVNGLYEKRFRPGRGITVELLIAGKRLNAAEQLYKAGLCAKTKVAELRCNRRALIAAVDPAQMEQDVARARIIHAKREAEKKRVRAAKGSDSIVQE